MSIAGREETLLVDSGAAGTGISINDIERFPLKQQPRIFSSSVRLTRIEQHSAARLDGAVSLAGLTFEEPVIEGVPGTQLLGGEILQHFVMTLDQKKRRLSLQATSSEAVPPQPRFELGIGYRPTDEGLLVTEVFADTPAGVAGLQRGDLVTAIDGARPDQRGCNSFAEDDMKVRFTVVRNGSALDKTLVMKPVIAVQ
jgi:predicted metalloprotease with PDZ domain